MLDEQGEQTCQDLTRPERKMVHKHFSYASGGKKRQNNATLISVVIYGRETVSKVQLDRGLYLKSLYYKM